MIKTETKAVKKRQTNEEKQVYYVNPNSPIDAELKLFCTNDHCVNFIPVHQTCNLKTVLISAKGKCEFSVNRKKKKLKAHERKN